MPDLLPEKDVPQSAIMGGKCTKIEEQSYSRKREDFPAVQWLRLEFPKQGAQGSISGQGDKMPHAATKSSYAITKDPTCRNKD